MMQTDTDPRLVKLRKYESILVISGFGVIAFGLWSIIRAAIYYFLNPLDVADYLQESELVEVMDIGKEAGADFITDNLATIITVVIFFVLTVDLLLRLYIGLSARRDGRRLKKSWFYIVVAWLMAISMFSNVAATMDDFFKPIVQALTDSSNAAIEEAGRRGDHAASVSVLVDITSLLVLLEVATCSIAVRRLRKKLGIKPVKKRKKGEKLEFKGMLTGGIKEELNIPMNKQEAKEVGEELAQQLSDGLNNIT